MSVLVLNAGYEPLQHVSVKHAIRMLVREVAVVEEADEERTIGHFPVPKVLRLVRYVKMAFRYRRKPSWSKRRLLRRDKYTCAYCGGHATTVDHVTPKSQGGKNTWENTVAACGGKGSCNNRKADRTPREAGMKLRFDPRVPTWEEIDGWEGR